MNPRRILATTLLGLTLAWPFAAAAAGPRDGPWSARPSTVPPPVTQGLSATEALCQHLGRFAYARASERDAGMPLIESLRVVREWNQTHGTNANTQHVHETIIRNVYMAYASSPTLLLQLTESACLEARSPQR
jgi:hypothetical protein